MYMVTHGGGKYCELFPGLDLGTIATFLSRGWGIFPQNPQHGVTISQYGTKRYFFIFFLLAYHSWRPGNRDFYLMSHSMQLPPARDLGPGVIILQYLKSKEDSIFVLT